MLRALLSGLPGWPSIIALRSFLALVGREKPRPLSVVILQVRVLRQERFIVRVRIVMGQRSPEFIRARVPNDSPTIRSQKIN